MNDKIFKELIKLSNVAYKKGEVPVAALIVKDNKIISRAYNKKEIMNNPLMHAEVLCINKASKKLNTWILDGCTLYSTLEPCHMCKEIIKESRIKQVYYLLKSDKIINYHTIFSLSDNDYSLQYKEIIQSFFKKLR